MAEFYLLSNNFHSENGSNAADGLKAWSVPFMGVVRSEGPPSPKREIPQDFDVHVSLKWKWLKTNFGFCSRLHQNAFTDSPFGCPDLDQGTCQLISS